MESVRKTFISNIKRLRESLDWKQRHLAEALDIEITTVGRWESGARFPDPEMIDEIAGIFEVPVSSLFDDGKNTKEPVTRKEALKILADLEGYELGAKIAEQKKAAKIGMDVDISKIPPDILENSKYVPPQGWTLIRAMIDTYVKNAKAAKKRNKKA